jgi:hypothetical protein
MDSAEDSIGSARPPRPPRPHHPERTKIVLLQVIAVAAVATAAFTRDHGLGDPPGREAQQGVLLHLRH